MRRPHRHVAERVCLHLRDSRRPRRGEDVGPGRLDSLHRPRSEIEGARARSGCTRPLRCADALEERPGGASGHLVESPDRDGEGARAGKAPDEVRGQAVRGDDVETGGGEEHHARVPRGRAERVEDGERGHLARDVEVVDPLVDAGFRHGRGGAREWPGAVHDGGGAADPASQRLGVGEGERPRLAVERACHALEPLRVAPRDDDLQAALERVARDELARVAVGAVHQDGAGHASSVRERAAGASATCAGPRPARISPMRAREPGAVPSVSRPCAAPRSGTHRARPGPRRRTPRARPRLGRRPSSSGGWGATPPARPEPSPAPASPSRPPRPR